MTSAPAIGAIETRYQGVRFRSRLEARWAVFFDALGIPWEFEPEGYTDGRISYLPDFWLPGEESFWETKPSNHRDTEPGYKASLDKAYMLSSLTLSRVFVCCGPPEHALFADPRDGVGYHAEAVDQCGHLGLFAWTETTGRGPHLERRDGLIPGEYHVRGISNAAAKARGYRFWDPK